MTELDIDTGAQQAVFGLQSADPYAVGDRAGGEGTTLEMRKAGIVEDIKVDQGEFAFGFFFESADALFESGATELKAGELAVLESEKQVEACICVKEAIEDAFFSVIVCGFGGAFVALEGSEAAQELMKASEVADREVDGHTLGDL